MKVLQMMDAEQDQRTAEIVLDFLLGQVNSIGGRIIPPSPSKPDWRVQAFFRDEPELTDDQITEMGMMRVTVIDSQCSTLGIKQNPNASVKQVFEKGRWS